jgi:predicted DNA-binding ArsR family transcriptional regulator
MTNNKQQTMTPKDKAKELVSKMEKDFQYFASRQIAIQHALIAVDEILSINSVDKDEDLSNYWEEVKQEIETYGGGEQ